MSEHKKPRQVDRVLAVLRAHPEGVNETAFALPNVIDGGTPIRRVAPRIFELRQDGFDIETHRESNGTATYKLIEVAAVDETGQTFLISKEAA